MPWIALSVFVVTYEWKHCGFTMLGDRNEDGGCVCSLALGLWKLDVLCEYKPAVVSNGLKAVFRNA